MLHGADALLERSGEIRRLESLCAAASEGRGAVAVVEGPAGVGKTSVLALARHIGAAHGGEVRAARTGPLESGLGWNVVRQLFADVIAADGRARARLLRGAGMLAAPALGVGEGSDSGALHGLYWLTAELAGRTAPLVLIVDDVQWADAASLRYLAYLALRVEDLPVVILLALRSGEAHDEALDAIVLAATTTSIRLHALTAAGSAEFVRQRLGPVTTSELCAACHVATGGNPFLLGELVGQIQAEGVDVGDPDNAGIVEGLRPETVTRGVLLRLARLGEDARAAAEAVAVLGEGAALGDVAALAGLGLAGVERAVQALAAAGIVLTAPLRFAHPIVHRVITAELGPIRLARSHATAARILGERHVGPERVALHLLYADPAADPWVLEQLRRAARDALRSGAADAASAYLRRALAEPPDEAARAEVLYELGAAESRAELGGSDHMRAALELTADPRRRAEIALVLGHTLGLAGNHGEAVDVLTAGLAEPHDDPVLRGLLQGESAGQALHAADKLEAVFELLATVSFDQPVRHPGEHRLRVIAGHGALGVLPADQSRALAVWLADSYEPSSFDDLATVLFIAELLVYVDEIDRAVAILDDQIAQARASGTLPAVALAAAFRAQAGLRRGTLAEAEADGRMALGVLDSDALGYSRAYVLSFLIDVLVERGQLEGADTILKLAGPSDGWPAIWQYALLARSAGRLRRAQGRIPDAVALLRDCAARVAPWDVHNPSVLPWRADLAEALVLAGEHEEARDLSRAELEDARKVAPPRGLGIALRACGIAERGSAGIALLDESVAVLAASVSRLEQARAVIDLGAAQRRAGERRAARDTLRQGIDLAVRCGAGALVSRAEDELIAAGGRPRARGEVPAMPVLTPAELRVAQLAAAGRTNREVAQALFVSLRTVETHLTHVYQKLDLKSRTELARALRGLEGS